MRKVQIGVVATLCRDALGEFQELQTFREFRLFGQIGTIRHGVGLTMFKRIRMSWIANFYTHDTLSILLNNTR
ncbi:MAG TPA: hypothetical protein VK901_08265 [Nitrospiraceae bacterium]|nr:hypothetical protein [Nitrospiraceae bacterium]